MNIKLCYSALFIINLFLLSTFSSPRVANAQGVDFGIGIAFDPIALDIQLGYEFEKKDSSNYGIELQSISGFYTEGSGSAIEKDISFKNRILFATTRPENWWIKFKAGLAYSNYTTTINDYSTIGNYTSTTYEDTGRVRPAIGISLVRLARYHDDALVHLVDLTVITDNGGYESVTLSFSLGILLALAMDMH